ncbi:mucolipin-3-like protein [Dinothrombium tinctorium]|uniref:Mucolipin-3-like protein n=1 Tax=Dinothrombium tinctorium TaxID=1965070 RepID=A0A443RPU9_9ACAR|nr:mucolipin-3-like protein [Dinothrombium tinctorium]
MASVIEIGQRSRRQTMSDVDRDARCRSIVGARRRANSCRCIANNTPSNNDSKAVLTESYANQGESDCNATSCSNMSSYTPHLRDKMRRKIKYFFMNPLEKWRAKGRFPWKLLVQVIKILVVTVQIVIYGIQMSHHINHQGNVVTTFRELFLQNWDPVREVMAYPPSAGPYAIYERDDFYEYIDFAVKSFAFVSTQAIGTFGYATNSTQVSPINFCKKQFFEGKIDPSSFTVKYDNRIIRNCTVFDVDYPPSDERWNSFSSKDYFEQKNISIPFEHLLTASLEFDIRTIYINSLESTSIPQCYQSHITILFDNSLHDGQMLVSLNAENTKHECKGIYDDYRVNHYTTIVLNIITIILCSLSLIMCSISLYKGVKLKNEVTTFFHKYFGHQLTCSEKYEFIDLWIVTIIFNDILIIIGSCLWENEYREHESYHYNVRAIFLGVGTLLVWIGVLRYLSFFRKYNIIILTIKRAIPDIIRFMICAFLLYGGFCICGWVVLGPYHIKFRTLSTASECLFSLLNGDDMFATFAILDETHIIIWWFSRIYLYAFISLFIYVVLSLFIALIMDSYETIKEFYENGFPYTDLEGSFYTYSFSALFV